MEEKIRCSVWDVNLKELCKLPAKYRTEIDPTDNIASVHDRYKYLCDYHMDYYMPHLLVSGFKIKKACQACGSVLCNEDCQGALLMHQMGEEK